ncbi:MAG: serine--tRNA ligase, partial [Elusimicrobia bacterium]|nr:serine--tRNA ligase [Elusimicrobiota bacterium]
MLDIKLIRENPEKVKNALETRGQKIILDDLLNWDTERRTLLTQIEDMRGKRNKAAEDVAKLKKDGKNPLENLVSDMDQVREQIKEKENYLVTLEQKIEDFALRLPNIPDETTPLGKSPEDNKVLKQEGDIKSFDFTPKPHWEVGEKLKILDFETASKISGSRFALLRGAGCILERALISYFLDTHIKAGYTEIFAPYLVNRASMQGTGQLPKFEVELFRCNEDDLYLVPTAEVSITNIHRDEFLEEKELPKKYVSYSACFRREAGSYGKDTKGLIRNHQFNKVELVKFVKPEDSSAELESLTADAMKVLKGLGLTCRVAAVCTGDLGFSSSKTYDLEVWMPGEKRWREISSCSNFKNFQARRMNIKVKYLDKRKD